MAEVDDSISPTPYVAVSTHRTSYSLLSEAKTVGGSESGDIVTAEDKTGALLDMRILGARSCYDLTLLSSRQPPLNLSPAILECDLISVDSDMSPEHPIICENTTTPTAIEKETSFTKDQPDYVPSKFVQALRDQYLYQDKVRVVDPRRLWTRGGTTPPLRA